jgi:hypothetical protein
MASLRRHFGQEEGLAFREVLSTERLERALDEEMGAYRHRVYPPMVTLAAMVSQVLSEDHSCCEAVARVLADRVARGEPACSSDTGAYCKARARLPEALLARLLSETGRALDESMPTPWLWQGRVVKIVDGTTTSMPDTPANQACYPQPESQAAGIGFPMLRLVGVLSLSSGAVLEVGFGPYQGKASGEHGLLRPLLDSFCAGDVLLGDSYYGTYWLLAALQQRQADGVFEVHARRTVRFGSGITDQVVVWDKPEQRPEWMDEAQYQAMPAQLTVRLIKSKGKVLVTTLLDRQAVSRRALMKLYSRRWLVEVDLKFIKEVLQMDVLRGRTPEMVRKEIYVHLLSYNLIRTVMAQAAHQAKVPPRQLSFKATVQLLNAFREKFLSAPGAEQRQRLYREMLKAIARHRIGRRPGRYEPRAVKRRPEAYPKLTQPRAQAREKLVEQANAA